MRPQVRRETIKDGRIRSSMPVAGRPGRLHLAAAARLPVRSGPAPGPVQVDARQHGLGHGIDIVYQAVQFL